MSSFSSLFIPIPPCLTFKLSYPLFLTPLSANGHVHSYPCLRVPSPASISPTHPLYPPLPANALYYPPSDLIHYVLIVNLSPLGLILYELEARHPLPSFRPITMFVRPVNLYQRKRIWTRSCYDIGLCTHISPSISPTRQPSPSFVTVLVYGYARY